MHILGYLDTCWGLPGTSQGQCFLMNGNSLIHEADQARNVRARILAPAEDAADPAAAAAMSDDEEYFL